VGAAGGRSLRGAAEATTTVWTAKKVGGSAATEPLGGWEGRPVPLPIGRMDWWNGRAVGHRALGVGGKPGPTA